MCGCSHAESALARVVVIGAGSEPFFEWQERTADALWDLAARLAPWPPQTARDALAVTRAGLGWVFGPGGLGASRVWPLVLDALSPATRRLRGQSAELRTFVDGQLLISAQLPSERANCLYAAAALDLPRAGAAHCAGGVGRIAETIAAAVLASGGEIRYRTEAVSVVWERGRPSGVVTADGETIPADTVVANTTPWDARRIFGSENTRCLRHLSRRPEGNGAFMLYAGIDGSGLPDDLPLHHQVIAGRPYGSGNTVFASLSPAWDAERAPEGHRSLTLSTHTPLQHWWDLHKSDRAGYDALRAELTDKVLETAERAIPLLRERAVRVFPATPLTFQRFTHREAGWVGGFPQRTLLSALGPRVGHGAWLVGDSISPGQSTAAVALSGMRVASMILAESS